MINHQNRLTTYKTIQDPVSNKQLIEVVQYLYNKVGELEPTHSKGHEVDKKA
jgi:hypothetical protein